MKNHNVTWEVQDNDDSKDCFECGWAKNNAYTIQLSPEVVGVIRKLCNEIKEEWQMLLRGSIDDVNRIVNVEGYYIPKQIVTLASVKNMDCIDEAMCRELEVVSTIHSHSNMKPFFSKIDEDSTNSTPWIRHHIVTNNDREYEAVSMIDLPCKRVTAVEAKVIENVVNDIVIEGIDNIEKCTYKDACTNLPAHYNRQPLWLGDNKNKKLNKDTKFEVDDLTGDVYMY